MTYRSEIMRQHNFSLYLELSEIRSICYCRWLLNSKYALLIGSHIQDVLTEALRSFCLVLCISTQCTKFNPSDRSFLTQSQNLLYTHYSWLSHKHGEKKSNLSYSSCVKKILVNLWALETTITSILNTNTQISSSMTFRYLVNYKHQDYRLK